MNLEDSLTDSIRRAKEKIYNQTTNFKTSGDQEASLKAPFDVRVRTHSHKMQRPNKTQENALAAAMKNLQDRIATLERQKRQIWNRSQFSGSNTQEIQRQLSMQNSKMRQCLDQKQLELTNITRQNIELNKKNTQLFQKNINLQNQVARARERMTELEKESSKRYQIVEQKSQQGSTQKGQIDISGPLLLAKDKKIAELQEKIHQFSCKYEQSHQAVAKLSSELQAMRKMLEKQKNNNIKLHKLLQQKWNGQNENNSLQINCEEKLKTPYLKRVQNGVLQNNKELSRTNQKNKIRLENLNRQKDSSDKFDRLKRIVAEIVEAVKKIVPYGNSNLQFLFNKIDRIDHSHLESLRSVSGHSYSNRGRFRKSHSRQHKKSLKMSDLNSSSKKSVERSVTKSSKKIKIDPTSHSQKKYKKLQSNLDMIQSLEKEVKRLTKEYRNKVMLSKEGEDFDGGESDLLLQKKEQLRQLKEGRDRVSPSKGQVLSMK